MPVGEEEEQEEGKGNGTGYSSERACMSAGSFVLKLFSLLQVGRSHGRISAKYSSVFQVCSLRVMVSNDWSVTGQRVISHCSWSWHHAPGFAAFLGLELKHN